MFIKDGTSHVSVRTQKHILAASIYSQYPALVGQLNDVIQAAMK